jgi:hypothetical protein
VLGGHAGDRYLVRVGQPLGHARSLIDRVGMFNPLDQAGVTQNNPPSRIGSDDEVCLNLYGIPYRSQHHTNHNLLRCNKEIDLDLEVQPVSDTAV